MTPNDFIKKWRDVELSERPACHQHFLDLCEMIDHPKPADVDKAGDFFTFEVKEGFACPTVAFC